MSDPKEQPKADPKLNPESKDKPGETTEGMVKELLETNKRLMAKIEDLEKRLNAKEASVSPERMDGVSGWSRSRVGYMSAAPDRRSYFDHSRQMIRHRGMDNASRWTNSGQDFPINDLGAEMSVRHHQRIADIRRYQWMANNREFARSREDTMTTARMAMGPRAFLYKGTPMDPMRSSGITGTDVAFAESVFNKTGYMPGNSRYVVLPMRNISGYNGTGKFSKDPTVNAHLNRMGGASYVRQQNSLREYYAEGMDHGQLESQFAHLANNPTAQQVFSKINRRRNMLWPSDPSMRYGDLAWARSQLEYIEKSNKQMNDFNGGASVYAKDYTPEQEEPCLHKEWFAFNTGRYNAAGTTQLTITLPKITDENQPGYGEKRYVLLQPNQPQKFWDSKSIQYARDAGIDFRIEQWPDGRTRGVWIKFKQPGIYGVGPRQVVVDDKEGTYSKEIKKREEERPLDKALKSGVLLPLKGVKPRSIVVTPLGGDAVTLDVSRLGTNGHTRVDGDKGVTAYLDSKGNVALAFFQEGTYSMNVFFEGDRQVPFQVNVGTGSKQQDFDPNIKRQDPNQQQQNQNKQQIDTRPIEQQRASLLEAMERELKDIEPHVKPLSPDVFDNLEIPEMEKRYAVAYHFYKNHLEPYIEKIEDLKMGDDEKAKKFIEATSAFRLVLYFSDASLKTKKRKPVLQKFQETIGRTFPELSKPEFFGVLENSLHPSTDTRIINNLLSARGESPDTTLAKAAALRDALKIKFDLTSPAKGSESFDRFASLLYLAQAKYAPDIIDALQTTDMLVFGFGWQPPFKRDIDIEEDRSSIVLLSNRLLAETGFDAKPLNDKRELIIKYWLELRELQEKSFNEGPDLDKDGKPKPIDFLVITDNRPEDGGGLPRNGKSLENMNKTLNAHESQKGKGVVSTMTIGGKKDSVATMEEIKNKCTEEEKKSEAAGHHLMVVVNLHGSMAGIQVPLKNGTVDVPASRFLEGINSEKTSLHFHSCFVGQHIMSLLANDSTGKLRNAFKNVSGNTSSVVNGFAPDSFEFQLYAKAYVKGADGKFAADINGDGKVTLNELHYWADMNAHAMDPIRFSNQGTRITANEGPKDDTQLS